MEKAMESSAVVLEEKGNVGVVQIADDVVAMIASLAATEVEGVSAMVGNITNAVLASKKEKKQKPSGLQKRGRITITKKTAAK